jgi:hypothetical protein
MKQYPRSIAVLRRIVLGLAISATVVAAAWVEEDYRGERAWRRFAKQCADKGEPLDYAFYKPEAIPDDQNFYRAPVLARFFDPKDTEGKTYGNYGPAKTPPWGAWQPFSQWQRGVPTDLAAAYRIWAGKPTGMPDLDRRTAATRILDQMKAMQPDLDALREAARQRPDSQIEFLTDGTFVRNSFGAFRIFGTALPWRANAELALGRNDEAFGDVYASLRLVEGMVRFPSYIHLMMANVVTLRALQPFWEGYVRHVWSDAQLREIQQLVQQLHPVRVFPVALAAHRAAAAKFLESEDKPPLWMPLGWLKLNYIALFNSGFVGDPASFDPVLERIDLGEVGRLKARLKEAQASRSPFAWVIRKQAWSPVIIVTVASAQNCFQLAEAACGLERYRLAHGSYPETLAELVPTFLPSVPRDVIDGAPLRYARTGPAKFLLYSLGQNGVDDHGALPGPLARPSMPPWYSQEGDWVWPMPAQ